MKIKIPSAVAELLKTPLEQRGIINPDRFRFHDHLELDLSHKSPEDGGYIKGLLQPHLKTTGVRAAVRDIDAWLMLKNGDELPRARTCQAAAGLLKTYIERSPRRHLYSVTSGRDGSAPLAYYVDKIVYDPPGRDSPPSVRVSLRFNQFGEIGSTSIYFGHEDVQGKTPEEMLTKHGYYLENSIHRDDYEFYLEEYEKVVSVIGAQYLATGTGSTRDDRWYSERSAMTDDQGNPSRVVIDVFREKGESSSKEKDISGMFWSDKVYAETMQRPLYTVQCSQLGIDAASLEQELLEVFARSRRWGALLLLDEADVYIRERGGDLMQNAIVGVFLRVLEYYDGILFMTTNRGDLVDDAVLSRCTCRLTYGPPSVEDQSKIWLVLCSINGVWCHAHVASCVVKEFPRLTGRDIKNIIKLCMLKMRATPNSARSITLEMVQHMMQFKPTNPVTQ